MTILDDLFKEANGLWNSIQGTADSSQLVKIDAAIASTAVSDLKGSLSLLTPRVLGPDTLIYNPPITLKSSASFVGPLLTITAPNFHIFPVQPSYGMFLENPPASPAETDNTGKFLYFQTADRFFFVVTLCNLRLETS
jgi:hypothetical protein